MVAYLTLTDTLPMLTPKDLSEGVSEGKKIKINRYIKEVNNERTERGISDVIIDLNWKWIDLQEKSLEKLKEMKSNPDIITGLKRAVEQEGHKADNKLVNTAFDELMDSIIKSLNSTSSSYAENDDKYNYYGNNIKENKETGDIYFLGKKHLEITTKEPVYKEKKRRAKTIVKDAIKAQLPNNVKNYKIKKEELAKLKLI